MLDSDLDTRTVIERKDCSCFRLWINSPFLSLKLLLFFLNCAYTRLLAKTKQIRTGSQGHSCKMPVNLIWTHSGCQWLKQKICTLRTWKKSKSPSTWKTKQLLLLFRPSSPALCGSLARLTRGFKVQYGNCNSQWVFLQRRIKSIPEITFQII